MAERDTARPGLAPLPALDGLRGWAVAAVVAYHLRLVPGGFLGVDVFFVLSGFLVTSLLLIEVDGTGGVSLGRFWVRRVRRLVPAVVVLVPSVLVAAVATGWPRARWDDIAVDGVATLTWWANWRQIGGGASYWAPDPSPFRHAWSLSIEEQFYVLWPLVLAGAVALAAARGRSVRRTVGVVAGTGAVVGFAWLLFVAHRADDLSRVYLGTDTRLATPLVGCALACWWTADRRAAPPRLAPLAAPVGLAALAVMVATVGVDDPATYRWGLFPVAAVAAAALLVGLTAATTGPLARVGTDPVSRYLGTRSYGIYLWSWPIQVIVERRWDDLSHPVVVAVVVGLSVAVAEVSFRLVEHPIRRGTGWARPAVARRGAALVGVAIAVVAVVAVGSRATEAPVHERLTADDVAADAATRPPPTTAAPDAPGARGLRVMIVGDSVAFTLAYHANAADLPPEIESIDGRGVIGCAALAGAGWTYPDPATGEFTDRRGGEACARQHEAEATGLTGRPDVVVAVLGAWEYSAARDPDGRTVAAQSDEMRAVLIDAVLERARAADEVGAAFALVEWACPGPEASDERRDPEYVRWLNGVLHDAAEQGRTEGLRTVVLGATDVVCAGGDPEGAPTAEWLTAVRDEIHVGDREGARWVWTAWLGPALASAVEPG